MNRPRSRVVVILMLFLALALVAPRVADACQNCRYSPNHWGFCYDLYPTDIGYDSCSTVVVDSFNGTTDCQLSGAGCGSGGYSNPFCEWTDPFTGQCIMNLY